MRQRLWLAGVLLLAAVAVSTRAPSAEIKKGPLAAGKDVPGAFHPFNVTARTIPPEELEAVAEDDKEKEKEKEKDKKPAPTSRGRYHCLVSEYDLEPVVMLFAHGLDDNEAFRDLLKKLDEACTKHRPDRLRAFVVFLYDDLTNVATQDEKREELIKKIEKVQDALKLSNVVLTLGCKPDLKKYALPEAALTVVMYRNLKVQASRALSRDDLNSADSAEIKAVLDDVTGKLLPRR
jgi:hypothetical protein